MDNNDIELFSTTDFNAKKQVVSILVKHRVSYLERWEKVPLLKRREYGGAKELCVIYVNGNQYGKAKKILDEFNESYMEAKRTKRRRKRGEAAEDPGRQSDPGNAEDERNPESYDPIDEGIDEGIDDL